MAISQNSRIDRSDINSMYTSFNNFISSYGGGMAGVGNAPGQYTTIYASTITTLNNKIDNFKSDAYLGTQSSWWSKASNVTKGRIIYASDMNPLVTTVSNFSKVKCRNTAKNTYGNNANCCNSNAKACANVNNNPQTCSHNCSKCCNSNAASCANTNNKPQTCSHNCSNCCNSNAKACGNSNNKAQSCSHSYHSNCCNSNAKACGNANNTAQACTSKTCSNWQTTCNLLCGQNDQSCAWSCAPQGNCPVAARVNSSTVCNLLGYSVSPYQCYQHANFCVWGCGQNYTGCSATVIRCNKTCSYSTHSNCCNSNAASCANSNNNPQTCSHNCSNCCNSNAKACGNSNNKAQSCSHSSHSNCCNSNAKTCANTNNNPQSCSHSSHSNCCNSKAQTCANTNYRQSCNPRGTTIDITCSQSTKTKT